MRSLTGTGVQTRRSFRLHNRDLYDPALSVSKESCVLIRRATVKPRGSDWSPYRVRIVNPSGHRHLRWSEWIPRPFTDSRTSVGRPVTESLCETWRWPSNGGLVHKSEGARPRATTSWHCAITPLPLRTASTAGSGFEADFRSRTGHSARTRRPTWEENVRFRVIRWAAGIGIVSP